MEIHAEGITQEREEGRGRGTDLLVMLIKLTVIYIFQICKIKTIYQETVNE